jgi:hypothetical protein
VAIHGARGTLTDDGKIDEKNSTMLRAMGAQVVEFALARRAWRQVLREPVVADE